MAHRSRLCAVLIDSAPEAFEAAVAFWSAALGGGAKPGQDPGARYLHLKVPRELNVDVILQRDETVDAAAYHVDFETDDVEAEVRRLEALGARRRRQIKDWWVLEAPSGHVFCVVPVQAESWPAGAVEWPDLE